MVRGRRPVRRAKLPRPMRVSRVRMRRVARRRGGMGVVWGQRGSFHSYVRVDMRRLATVDSFPTRLRAQRAQSFRDVAFGICVVESAASRLVTGGVD